ncbi:PREDICTED: E3 ubiquitin-protein ligase TRIM56 [Gekko japonicus]|uniref:RING-type E3 ubiquitin transferase n=1 Tax=Gekko japonicus TaxID=146911 RepID=A0ABM1K9G9_GEKJA|nr:PREDICTED: E3 ubiquitin-protein ligase TRIM56 [Gekko japonicus]
MAARASSLSEALSSGFLTCTICLEHLCQPKILPCLHTFCRDCLQQLASGREELQCPECRERVPLPAGVEGLKTNFFINGLLDLIRPAGRVDAPCSLCPLLGQDTSRCAVSRCLDCADNLCQTCASGHRCSRLTHAHCIVDMEGYLSGEHDEEVRKRQASCCQEHSGEALRFFCTPCATALCRECRLGPHLEHPCLPLSEAAEARCPIIVGLLAGVEEKVGLIAQARARLEEQVEQLQAHAGGVRGAMERTCSQAVQQLLALQEEVLAQLSGFVEERKKAAEVLRSELEFQEQVASSTAAFARKVLSLGRAVEIVSLEQMISERLRQLQSFSWEPLAFRLPHLAEHPNLQSLHGLFHLEFREEPPPGGPESANGSTPKGAKKKRRKSQQLLLLLPTAHHEAGRAPGQQKPSPPVEPPSLPPARPEAPPLTPKAVFSSSFWVKVPSDKKRPQVTGICPLGSGELLVADMQNRKLKRFSLQGEFKGLVSVPSDVAPFSVAAVGGRVAFSAGSRLFLLSGEGGLLWQKALQLGQASHAVTAVGGNRVVVSVAGHLELYDVEGRLVEKVVPGGSEERSLVFLASRKGGFVASDWYRRSLLVFGSQGQLVAERREEELDGCQPGAVCVDATGIIYVVLREQNRVLAFSQAGKPLGPFLTAEDSIDRPRVATVTGDGRFAVALSNGTIHTFKIRYQSK